MRIYLPKKILEWVFMDLLKWMSTLKHFVYYKFPNNYLKINK